MAPGDPLKPDRQSSPHWADRRLWQIQPVRDCLLVAGVIALVMLGARMSVVTVPLGLAMVLAYLFEPVISRLTRIRWLSREGAVVAVIASVVFIVVAPLTLSMIFALGQGLDYSERFASNVSRLNSAITATTPERFEQLEAELPSDAWRWVSESVRDYRARQAAAPEATDDVPAGDANGALLSSVVSSVASYLETNRGELGRRLVSEGFNAVTMAIRLVTSAGFLLFTAFLTAFFFFFCSTGYGRLKGFWRSLIPDRNRDRTLELLGKMDRVIASFIRGRLVIAIIQSVLFTIAYWIIGVPAPMILGPIVGFLSIVPYLALIGIPISVLLLLLEPSGVAWQTQWWWVVGAPVVVYFGLQALDDYVLTPKIQGKGTGMDTPTILFSTIAGGAILGVFGMLLAIPIAACLKILIVEVYWPRFQAWTEGRSVDPLPLSASDAAPDRGG
ncbi:MAG: AI-2E family transporter [Phycisphaeraceae bacterium]|nr:AI-2E family transporter [Phycisphaeraceae bacterium]